MKLAPYAARVFSPHDLRIHDIDTLKARLRPNLDLYKLAIKTLSPTTRLFRGVRVKDRPDLISRISYPPAAIAKLGRANRDGAPMFYCAAGEPAIFFELRAQPGDLIAMSAWTPTKQLWVHHLGYHGDALERIGTTAREAGKSYSIRFQTRAKETPVCGDY